MKTTEKTELQQATAILIHRHAKNVQIVKTDTDIIVSGALDSNEIIVSIHINNPAIIHQIENEGFIPQPPSFSYKIKVNGNTAVYESGVKIDPLYIFFKAIKNKIESENREEVAYKLLMSFPVS